MRPPPVVPRPHRRARLAAALLPLPALWACQSRRLEAPSAPPDQELVDVFEQNKNRDIDIVFVVDNSLSMANKQEKLAASFPAFMNVLKSVPGGLPDVHIGVVSSSLGAGAYADVGGCPPGGDRGAFQKSPRGAGGKCTAVPKDSYIISLEKGTRNNFQGDISEVFSCIAQLGEGGCGYEHQLAAARRALGGDPGGAPPENSGFLREDAYLALVFLTDEDDCSAPPDSDLFDTRQTSLSDPLGPPNSFRCNEFGHLCGGVRPPRTPASNLMDCHSAEGGGKLVPVSDYVGFFKTLKTRPEKVLPAAIAGPPAPYGVSSDGTGNPKVSPSCSGQGYTADPGVRMKEFIDAFGRNGTFKSICDDNLGPALDVIASKIKVAIGTSCIGSVLRDTDPNQDGLQPFCAVVDQTPTAGGGMIRTPLPNCESGGAPCWRMLSNPRECTASGFEFKVDRGASLAPKDTYTSVKCLVCANPDDPGCR